MSDRLNFERVVARGRSAPVAGDRLAPPAALAVGDRLAPQAMRFKLKFPQ